MSDNPLDDTNEARQQRIRERAYHLWEADGAKPGRDDEYWERARELTGMEESAGAAQLNPNKIEIAEEASIQKNLGEFPSRFSDQGDRTQFPSKENLTQE